ncbi:ABC transporter ATP-binding protein [Methylobacterium sp. NEAU 140]|uniref:ABC transporter ATP-binding protein n=1 Tax=Methylobacterium sp. NEAU 140 TaxID=3064945 RepID=UPI0027344732|nr:ABC transporter ATP-binding protein [Methylobacterium sp. NEAU 140]MDP4023979.1 ABC transporter ATP-binding protein [Methylobacterium sp. NEAU 140]
MSAGPAGTGAPLEIEGLTTGYGDVAVVREVTMAFPTGRMSAIIGSNGAGKSTVIKAAAGLLPVWSGRVRVGGADVTREAAHLRLGRGMAYVPQGRIVIPEMSVRDNLELGAHILGGDRARIDRAIERLVALFPILGQRLRQQAGTMSGGEQQMLAIARALITDPTTIILDEPSLGLSPKLVDVVFEKLTEISAAGLTVVMVEQKASRALAVAHRGYVMHGGRVAYAGEAAALLANENVKRLFLGEVPEELERAAETAA